MFDLESEIKAWRKNLERRKVGDGEVLDELESHLREEIGRLHKNGRTDEQLFQTAVNSVGKPEALKREFNILRHRRIWTLGQTPSVIKIVAGCFACAGIDFLACAIGLVSQADSSSHWSTGAVIDLILMAVLGASTLIITSGLLRLQLRRRATAFALLGFHAWYFVQGNWTYWRHLAHSAGLSSHSCGWSPDGLIFGVSVPISFAMVFSMVEFAILLCGCWLLLKPSMRKLFRTPVIA